MENVNSLCFRRAIKIVSSVTNGTGYARVALEDDYHHFRVSLTFCDNRLTAIAGEALRTPYSLCGNATEQLKKLIGMEVTDDPKALDSYTDQRHQCTHMFDEAGLALAAAHRHIRHRYYEVSVPRHVNGATRPQLWRDGQLLLTWDLRNDVIYGSEPFTDIHLKKGFFRWAQTNLDPDTAEAARVLRRCSIISRGRLRDIDQDIHAASLGYCYVQQPERATRALRMKGSTHDFTACPDKLLEEDREWLNKLGR